MKKFMLVVCIMVMAFSTVNVNAEGFLKEEEEIHVYGDEDDIQDEFPDEDELSWWQRWIRDHLPKEETITII